MLTQMTFQIFDLEPLYEGNFFIQSVQKVTQTAQCFITEAKLFILYNTDNTKRKANLRQT